MAIAEPLNNTTKSKFIVVYKEGDTGTVRSKSIFARSSGEAVADLRRSKKPVIGSTIKRSFIKSPRAFESPDKDNLAEAYKDRLSMMKVEQRKFDYQGYTGRKEYYINKAKNLIDKGEDKTKQLDRLERMNNYYKLHPKALKYKGKSETVGSIKRKLNSIQGDSNISRSARSEELQFQKTGSTYRPGKIQKVSTATGLFIGGPGIPIPGVSQALGAGVITIGNLGGSIYDKYKLNKLIKKNPKLGKAIKRKDLIERSIKRENKRLTKLAKNYQKKLNKKNKRK